MKRRDRKPLKPLVPKAGGPSPSKIDPTGTTSIRRVMMSLIRGKFARLKGKIVTLIAKEDALGLITPSNVSIAPSTQPPSVTTTVDNSNEDQPRDELGRWTSGPASGATKEEVKESGDRLLSKMKEMTREGRNMRIRQYMGQVKDFFPGHERLDPKVASSHVFYDPDLHKTEEAAGLTKLYMVSIGVKAFGGQGTSRTLGDTFVHEIEHLVDKKGGRDAQEFTPRYRQMMREFDDEQSLTQYLGKHGRDNAEYYIDSFFNDHPGHELTDEQKSEATEKLVERAKQLYKLTQNHISLSGDEHRVTGNTDGYTLISVPNIKQPNEWSCGSACALSVGSYYGVGSETLEEWSDKLGTNPEDGTDPLTISQYLKSLGLGVSSGSGMSLGDLESYTAQGWPIIVCVQDYGNRGSLTQERVSKYGHYLVVIGVSRTLGCVFCQDPSIDNVTEGSGSVSVPGRVMIDIGTFIKIWHDKDAKGTDYTRYGIAVGPGTAGKPGTKTYDVGSVISVNSFCATGEGGGVDPSCSPEKQIIEGALKEKPLTIAQLVKAVGLDREAVVGHLGKLVREGKLEDGVNKRGQPTYQLKKSESKAAEPTTRTPTSTKETKQAEHEPAKTRESKQVTSSTLTHESILQEFDKLLKGRPSHSSLVPIHELRRALEDKHGEGTAGHESLDHVLLRMDREDKLQLVSIGDRSRATTQQLKESIPGENETFFYVERGHTTNAFCPTGEGGGIDSSCSPNKDGKSGNGGDKDSSVSKSPGTTLLHNALEGWLKDGNLSPQQESFYRDAFHTVVSGMPEASRVIFHSNLDKVIFHSSTQEVTNAFRRTGGYPRGKVGGFWDFDPRSEMGKQGKGTLHVNGGSDTGEDYTGPTHLISHIYSHESGHVLDRGHLLSNSKEWREAYSSEIKTSDDPLSKAASKSPAEGFAEYARLLFLHPDKAKDKQFSKCYSAWKKHGLLDGETQVEKQ